MKKKKMKQPFKPYKGQDVAPMYVYLNRLGRWATIEETTPYYRRWIDNSPYRVIQIGWGRPDPIFWGDLTPQERRALLEARRST
jgi:hypothetical protein